MANSASKQLYVAPPETLSEDAGPSKAPIIAEAPAHHKTVPDNTTPHAMTENVLPTAVILTVLPSHTPPMEGPSSSTSIIPATKPCQ